eukprot:9578593-Alexandrium_andersonii.AAC.1
MLVRRVRNSGFSAIGRWPVRNGVRTTNSYDVADSLVLEKGRQRSCRSIAHRGAIPVSYTHLRAHETSAHL